MTTHVKWLEAHGYVRDNIAASLILRWVKPAWPSIHLHRGDRWTCDSSDAFDSPEEALRAYFGRESDFWSNRAAEAKRNIQRLLDMEAELADKGDE